MATLVMEALQTTAAVKIHPTVTSTFSVNPRLSYAGKATTHTLQFPLSCSSSSVLRTVRAEAGSISAPLAAPFGENNVDYGNRHWMVLLEAPPRELADKPRIIDFYVSKLQSVMESEKDAQMCIYDVSCDSHFGFCCDIDEETAHELASVPGIKLVRPDPHYDSEQKDYSFSKMEFNIESTSYESTLLFPSGTAKHWTVRLERPAIGGIRRAQLVDYYVQVLTRVLRNERDAQMCIYHVSWQSNYGFCCELDDDCARELTAVPGVLSVKPDENFGSDDKDYGGENTRASEDSSSLSNIKTKKLFVTGLSFYTSEKTLRAAFEGFGELVEVKVIMDKISKRSKGYAFVEYTTEEAAGTALREMNGQIINGWMITVDVAKKTSPNYTRGQPRATQ
ncbi:organelle RRM domain-containing protein 1, chloroplastic [Andrographis paniculata]|uniref:organelle RRM domain-containing protein 1, chloroplastic n=1 Tax=Andrographis paniculata TaxID=175694 RepID=UPI0021E7EF2D|nr:organelle RRM domain-containing protein 1, chloroplastic [Andrographis paniculata]